MVDITRLLVYGAGFLKSEILNNFPLLAVAVIAAFAGSYFSRKFIRKITVKIIRIIIIALLSAISLGLITGFI